MQALRNKVPPPLVALACLLGMVFIAPPAPALSAALAPWLRWLPAVLLGVGGAALGLAGTVHFRRARTTVNPLKPHKASALVVQGVYRFSRNPMYLGMLAGLLAVALGLARPWALLGPLSFFVWIDRLQIPPEEAALAQRFGADYAAYRQRVRRWL